MWFLRHRRRDSMSSRMKGDELRWAVRRQERLRRHKRIRLLRFLPRQRPGRYHSGLHNFHKRLHQTTMRPTVPEGCR